MAEHVGYIVEVKDLRPHPNADKLQLLHLFETDTCVGLDVKIGDIGFYIPSDSRLGERFCQVNGLLRQKDENGNPVGHGYLDPEKRNVKAIKLRGQRSDGIYLNISCLTDFCKISDLKVGDKIDVLNGEVIVERYIPRVNPRAQYHGSHGPKAVKVNVAPLFVQHVDTEQLAYNLDKFHNGDIIQLTLKCHGTSTRIGNLPILHTRRTWIDKLFHHHGKDYYEYGMITGTRRVILANGRKGGFYESDDFRHAMSAKLEGKIPKNMIVFGEIVGFQGPNGAPIMGQVANSKIKDKEFSKQYGEITTFSYGCEQDGDYVEHSILEEGREFNKAPCCELYVYRIAMTNDEGVLIELSPAQIHYYCDLWGVKYVPEFETFIIPDDVNAGEYVVRKVEQYYDGPDPIGKTHVREGVVARICNRNKFEVYKMKNFSFRVLEGIIKDEETAPDIEEAQEIVENVD